MPFHDIQKYCLSIINVTSLNKLQNIIGKTLIKVNRFPFCFSCVGVYVGSTAETKWRYCQHGHNYNQDALSNKVWNKLSGAIFSLKRTSCSTETAVYVADDSDYLLLIFGF
jgi:hypothetical protein